MRGIPLLFAPPGMKGWIWGGQLSLLRGLFQLTPGDSPSSNVTQGWAPPKSEPDGHYMALCLVLRDKRSPSFASMETLRTVAAQTQQKALHGEAPKSPADDGPATLCANEGEMWPGRTKSLNHPVFAAQWIFLEWSPQKGD